MEFKNICINCMHEKKEGQSVCAHCGFDDRTYVIPQYVLPPFTILNGKYLLGKVLGMGGFGITYLAMDLTLEHPVAIKEYYIQNTMYRNVSESSHITIACANFPQEKIYKINREKFENEAKTLASLSDLAGIVRVTDYFTEFNTAYIVMEYLPGLTLKEYVRSRGGKLSLKEIKEKLNPIMTSLQHVHERNIIHRDISPDNMKVLDNGLNGGQVKLFDFGGARQDLRSEDDPKSAVVLKKDGYTPIEQISGSAQQGPWTDVYAMAATIYFCICGKPPISSSARVADSDSFQTPSQLGVPIDKKVEEVLLKGLALRGQDRYQTMKEFQDALEKAGWGEDSKPHVKRWPFIVGGCLAVAVGVGIVIYNSSNLGSVVETKTEVETQKATETELDTETETHMVSEVVTEEELETEIWTEMVTVDEIETVKETETEEEYLNVVLEDGIYIIENYKEGQLALTVTHDIYDVGVQVQLDKISDSNTQKIWLRQDGDSYLITMVCSDKSLAVADDASLDGAQVIQDNFKDKGQGQVWYLEDAGDGAVFIKSQIGMYITVENEDVSTGAKIIMTKQRPDDCGKWIFTKTKRNHEDLNAPLRGDEVAIGEGTYEIVSRYDRNQKLIYQDSVWSVQETSDASYSKVEISEVGVKQYSISSLIYQEKLLTPKNEDTWKFVFSGGGTYCIKSESGEILTYDGTLKFSGNDEDTDDIDVSQRWYIRKTDASNIEKAYKILNSGGYIINRELGDLALSVRNDSLQSGSILQISKVGENISQVFRCTNLFDNKFILYNVNADKAVKTDEASKSIRISDDIDFSSHYWSLESTEDGYFYIKNAEGEYLCANLVDGKSVYSELVENTDLSDEFAYQWNIRKG